MDDWQNKSRSLPERAQYILSKKLLSDCEFIIDKEKVKCHKLILALASPVFQAMFFGGNAEPSGPIEIKDIGFIPFIQIIEYIYGASVDFSSYRNACDLYYGAKKYLLYFLERDCVEYLKNNLTNDNVLYVYEFAKFHNEEELQKQCITEIQLKTEDIIGENSLFEISEETLESILDLNLLNISSELYLFKAVEEWILINKKDLSCELQRDLCFGLFKKLRLLTLSVEEFAESPAKSKFLSDTEKLAVLLRITKAVQTPMNNGLCELTKKRKRANIKCMSILNITDLKHARCDGSEWLTSVFKTNSPINLIGVEIRLQVNEENGKYFENLMIKVGKAKSDEHFAEGSLCGAVQFNSKAQIMLNTVATLNPSEEYAVHVFLCMPGMYPIGRHTNLSCMNESVVIDFVSHSSWERAHPFNTTVISSLIYSDIIDES